MQTPRIDWSDWSLGPGRHPIQGAAQSGLAALMVTSVGAVNGWMPAGWPLIAGLALACAAAVAAAWQDMHGAVVAYRAACLLAAGVWSSATLAWSTPWSRWPLVTLATGTAVAATVGTGLARMQPKPEQPEPEPDPIMAEDPVVPEWQTRLRRITRRAVVLTAVEYWDPPTGFTLYGALPADGTTVRDIKDFEAQLAAAANLPEGCNVEVLSRGGGGRRLFRVRVATENAMAETHHLDEDPPPPLSIGDPLPVGLHSDRSHGTINLRYACAVLVGQTDSGKSNTLNVITHRVGQCTDAVAWAIDLSGNGRYPRPWLRAWVEGRADTPVIDWAAVTPDEAMLLTTAAVNVINGRTASYEQLMFQANDDKIPVSPELPQIIILVDEFADLPAEIKTRLETISNTGRGAGVRVVSSVLRAIGQDISRGMIVQARERIAMRVSDEGELQYLFDATWSRGRFDPASMPYQGSGLLSTGAAVPAPFKALRLEPAQIDFASVAMAPLRPQLDQVSAELAEAWQEQDRDGRLQQITGAYSRRWERTLPLMFPNHSQSALVGPTPADRPDTNRTSPEAATATIPVAEKEVVAMNLEESGDDLRQKVEAARAAREAAEAAAGPEPEVGEADWSVVEGWLEGAAPERVPPRVRMRQLVSEHRRDGIGPRAVHQQLQQEGYGTAEQTVIGWMRADAAAGILAQPGGKSTPYTVGPNFTLEQP